MLAQATLLNGHPASAEWVGPSEYNKAYSEVHILGLLHILYGLLYTLSTLNNMIQIDFIYILWISRNSAISHNIISGNRMCPHPVEYSVILVLHILVGDLFIISSWECGSLKKNQFSWALLLGHKSIEMPMNARRPRP